MSDAEKILLGIAVSVLAGAIVWLLQSNFNEIKTALKEIKATMVDKEVCAVRHRAIEDKLENHGRNIRALFQRTNSLTFYQGMEKEDDSDT